MYICICNAITEEDIQNEIFNGACTLKDLDERLQLGNCCGSCCSTAEELLQQDPTIKNKIS